MRNLIFIFCFFSSISSYSFDWNKCKRSWLEETMGTGVIVSTTSFILSTGDCSMIGKKSHDEKVFFAQNINEIRIDVVRGEGEYLAAFNSYSNCHFKGPKLQSNYKKIFVPDMESSFRNLKKYTCNYSL